jgi:hypothetical protein
VGLDRTRILGEKMPISRHFSGIEFAKLVKPLVHLLGIEPWMLSRTRQRVGGAEKSERKNPASGVAR